MPVRPPQTLTAFGIDAAARLLADARAENHLLDEIPVDIRPRSLADAYAIQDRLIELLGLDTRGWFCACTNRNIQAMLGLDEPYHARLLAGFVLASPATLRAAQFPPMVLECEFGFRLGRALGPRETPYLRHEVEEAIDAVHPTIEVVAGHLRNWPEQDVFSVIADNGTDGALVHGEGFGDWRSLDLVNLEVTLRVNGAVARSGQGRNVLGDPVDALVWLVNARRRRGDGLLPGHIHNTGTATDIIWIDAGDEAVAHFDGLGSVTLRVTED